MQKILQRHRHILLFASIYFVQGMLITFYAGFNPIYLRTFDLSFSRIGLVSGLVAIPMILKIIIGLISDRVSLFNQGHRKPYIIIGLILQALMFLLIPWISPVTHFTLYVSIFFLAVLGMSFYDTATDGLAIDTTADADRPIIQSIMVGGRAISSVLGALLLGYLAQRGQWNLIFYIFAGLATLVLPLALRVQEPAERTRELTFSSSAFKSLLGGRFILFLVYGFIFTAALYSSYGMLGAFLNEGLGMSLDRVGVLTSLFGVGTIIGALVGGPLMTRIGRRNSALIAGVLATLATAAMATAPSSGLAMLIVTIFGLAFGYYDTVFLAAGMDFSDPRIAAFMFAFIMAFTNIAIAVGQPLAGKLVDNLGFPAMFLIFAGVHASAIPFIFAIFSKHTRSVPVSAADQG